YDARPSVPTRWAPTAWHGGSDVTTKLRRLSRLAHPTRPASLRNLPRRPIPVPADMARPRGDAPEPGAHPPGAGEGDAAFLGDMGIRIERDVGDGVAVGGEELVRVEVPFHDAQCLVALLHPLLEGMHLQVASALDERQPEMGGAQVWLQTVLLEEHPLQHLAP